MGGADGILQQPAQASSTQARPRPYVHGHSPDHTCRRRRANTLVFSVLEGVLLKPLPYPKPDELVGVWHTAPGIQIKDLDMSPSDYFIYREQNKTLQDIGMYHDDSVKRDRCR